LVSSLAQAYGLRFFEPGKDYLYEIETDFGVGTGKDGSQRAMSGASFKGFVKFQASDDEVKVQLFSNNFKAQSFFNGPYEQGHWPLDNAERQSQFELHDENEISDYSFSVTYEHGKATGITVPDDAPTWVQNIMRSVASSFQVDLSNVESEMFWYSDEKLLQGYCNVYYNVESSKENLYVINKAVSHEDQCTSRVSHYMRRCDGDKGCQQNWKEFTPKLWKNLLSEDKCEYGECVEHDTSTEPFSSSSSSKIEIESNEEEDLFTVHKLESEGGIVAQQFLDNGVSYFSSVYRRFTLINVTDSEEDIEVTGVNYAGVLYYEFKHEVDWDADVDLKEQETFYDNEFGHFLPLYTENTEISNDQEAIQDSFYVAIQDFVEEHAADNSNDRTKEHIKNLHKKGILALRPFLTKLNYDSLYNLKERFVNEAEEVKNGALVKHLFTELLSATGSNPSAMLVIEMVMKQEYDNDFTAARELLSVPLHINRPTKKLLDEFKQLLEFDGGHYVKMAAPLAYATLARKTCQDGYVMNDDCENQLLQPEVEAFFEEFQNADIENIEELNKYMAMFSNFRWGGVHNILKPIIMGQTEHKDIYSIRAKAILAASYGILKGGYEEEFFLPLIMNEYENHEIRIIAFDNLMKGNPTKTTFIKIVTAMYWERDYEVFNYIYTSFEKLASTQELTSCNYETGQYARYFLKYWKEHMWLRPKYTFGISKTYSRSFVDETFGYGGVFDYHTIGSHKSSSPIAMYGELIGTHSQGHKMQMFGLYLRVQGLGARIMKSFKGNLNTDALKDILFQQMNIKEKQDEPIRAEIILEMQNEIIFQQYWDESHDESITEVVKAVQKIIQDGHLSINEDKIFNLPTFNYEMPTDIGMPVAYDAKSAMLGSLNAELELNHEDNEHKVHMFKYETHFNFQSYNGFTLFYGDKLAFNVRQNTIYKHNFGHQIKFGSENENDEMFLTVALSVPGQQKPLSLLMHSETIIEIYPNKLSEMPVELESTCSSCEQQYVLTKGDNFKKSQNFLELASEEMGMQAKASYFDCEAPFAYSTGSVFDKFGEFFATENKTPKDLYTAFTFGLLQMNYFFSYFPYSESCGVAFDWSQSSYNPVSEMRLRFRGVQNKDMKNGGGYFKLNGNLYLIGDIVREHEMFVKYEFENDRPKVHTLKEVFPKQTFTMKMVRSQFDLGAFNVPEYSICADLTQKLSVENDKYFFMDFNSEQKTMTDASFSFGPSGNCETNDHNVKVTGVSSTTEEARDHLKSKWYYYSCMNQKKSKEFHNFPLTDPCFYTADDLYTLRKFNFDIETANLPDWLKNKIYKAETWAKYYLLPYWEMDLENGENGYSNAEEEEKVELDLVFHSEEKTMDLEIQGKNQKSMFKGMKYWESENKDVSVEDYLPSSTFSPAISMLHNHNILNYCTASNKHIRTYDNVTYSYEMHDCWTLVSAHCTKDPEYAVFVKKDDNKQMALMVFVGGNKIEIIPTSDTRYDISVNDEETFDLSKDEAYYFPSKTVVVNGDYSESSYVFKIYKWEGTFTINSFLRMTVHYDGSHVNIVAPPHVKGHQCGMCGDFNRDHRYEMIGPQECQLRNGKDMAAAWCWDKDQSGECPSVDQECEYSEENYYVKQT